MIPVRIETARLVLRKPVIGDLADIHAVLGNAQAMRYWAHPAHDSIDQSRDWLLAMMRPEPASDDFLLEYQGHVIGKAGCWRLPEVGFCLHPDQWGKGLAREAMAAAMAHLFAHHPLDALTAEADPRNGASIGLLRRLGFVETHRAERTMQWGTEWCDSVYFRCARPQ